MSQLSHEKRVMEVVASPMAAAQSAVAASWRRSMIKHELRPDQKLVRVRLTERELREQRQRMEHVVRRARSTMDRLFQAVATTGSCVALTDTDGVILDRRSTAASEELFDSWGLCPGSVWSEAFEGTNGIGTCLAVQRRVTIHGNEHFHVNNIEMSCTDAPIFGPDGGLVGAIDVSTYGSDQTKNLLPLISSAVAEAARHIESQIFRATFPGARIIVCPTDDHGVGHLLAVSDEDLVIGATRSAQKALGLTSESFDDPQPVAVVLGLKQRCANLALAERSELKRALADCGGNVSAAARVLGIGRATLYRRMKKVGLH